MMKMKAVKKISGIKSPAAMAAISAAVLATLFLLLYFIFLVPHGTIARGISIGGVYVGDMTKEEAEAALLQSVPDKITVYTHSGEEHTFLTADASIAADNKAAVEAAYALGRDKNPFKNIKTLTGLLFTPQNLDGKYTADTEKLNEILYGFASGVIGKQEQYIFEFFDGGVNVSPGISGQSRDMTAERTAVLSALGRGADRIMLELKKTEPPVPSADSLFEALYIEPIAARYEITDGRVEFYPEGYGRQPDKIELGTKIEALKQGEAISLKLVALAPEITLKELNTQLFNHVLGSYVTTYSAANRSRSKNVELAAAKIDGIVLAPGEEFSYNNTVGKRSAENGFLPADVYSNGETVQGLGGGVCQVSSTLYCAVLYADLKTTYRRNHSMTVGYVPKGQDATVSYGTIDYRFENNTKQPIKIEAIADGGRLAISIYGTEPEVKRTVKITNTVLETVTPTIKESADPGLLTGNKRVISKGKTGYTVKSVRTVYENGKEVRSEDLGKSVYKMVPGEVAIGTRVPEPLPEIEETAALTEPDAEIPSEEAE